MRAREVGVLLVASACGSTPLSSDSVEVESSSNGPLHPPRSPSVHSTVAIGSGEPSHSAFFWQGMNHRWLRDVAGFQVPHRVSYLESLVFQESPGTNAARFSFGQSTGVDGNYMNPIGRWAAFHATDTVVLRGSYRFAGTDAISQDLYPQAHVHESGVIRWALPVGFDHKNVVTTGLIQGFALETTCDPKKQPKDNPCNSNGAWPIEFAFGTDDCTLEVRNITCKVTFDFARAWTPVKGGIPGIEEKPLNEKLDYQFQLNVIAVVGKVGAFAVSNDHVNLSGAIHDEKPAARRRSMSIPSGMSAVTVGFSSLGFRLFKTLGDDAANHLGRYIGALDFGLVNAIYEPTQGKFFYDATMQVWSPLTVKASGVAYAASTRVLQFATGGVANGSVDGALCINSTKDAPAASAWSACGTGGYAAERKRDEVSVP